MAKELGSLNLLEIVPPNLQKDPSVCSSAKALDQELQLVLKSTQEALHLPRINELPESVVDLLAWQWHVEFYEPLGLMLNRKRDLVRQSIVWHRYKGTPAVVEDVVKAAYGNCKLTEWYEYGGNPGTFKVAVTLEDESTDKNRWKNVISAINSVKNTRSWMEEILFYYPDIILPIEIHHHAKSQQYVNARHRVWNLGEARSIYWDGEFSLDGEIRLDGILPGWGYKEHQTHRAEVWLTVDAVQHNFALKNIWDGSFCLNGSHNLSGARLCRLPILRVDLDTAVDARQ